MKEQGQLAGKVAKLGQREAPAARLVLGKMYDLHENYRVAGEHLLHLLSFIELNATGVRKILKKFDKKFDYGLTEHYVGTRANHPFSQLQQLFMHMGIASIVEALTNGLNYLQECPTSSNFPPPPEDSIISAINGAMNSVNESSYFLHRLAKHDLVLEELPTTVDRRGNDNKRYHLMSLLLNLVNDFLYMVNTYVIVPTAADYSVSLGHASTTCGVMIGAMAFAQVFSTLYLSAWSNKTYFRPLLFSSIVLIIGNTLYALAYDFNSIWILLIGRFICGLGYAQPVNQRYISDCVPLMNRMYASAGLICAGALGVSCGPALAGLLQINFRIHKFTFNEQTLPGWVMTAAWLLYFAWLCISFKEPSYEENLGQDSISGKILSVSGKGITQPLVSSSADKQDNDVVDSVHKGSERASHQNSRRVTMSAASACGLLTTSVKVQLLIYFMLKYVVEILISGATIVTSHYFDWSTSVLSVFLALLTLTVIPANIFVGSYISSKFEERQILLASEVMVCIGILLGFHYKIPYSVLQYVCSAVVTFISAQILQGASLLLLSRLLSSRFSQGAFNGEVLSSEVGATSRVLADMSITLFGHTGTGDGKLLNLSLIPPLFMCVSSIVATYWTYNSLY